MNLTRIRIYVWRGIVLVAMLLPLMMASSQLVGTACGEDASIRIAQHTVTSAAPVAGREPVDNQGHMHISDQDRCPVCAMKVKNHSKFASAIQLKNGTTYYFCGTGCMIRSWMHPDAFLGINKSMLHTPIVRDYFTGTEMDARDAIWIAGSDIIGPMGPALVPLRNQKDFDAFIGRHGGKISFRLQEMDPEKWRAITGKRSKPKK